MDSEKVFRAELWGFPGTDSSVSNIDQ